MTEYFLLRRLEQYLDHIVDPWCVGFELAMVEQAKPQRARYSSWRPRSASWHAGRVKYLMQHPKLLNFPLTVDCECSRNRVLAVPVLIDGWHRYSAHRLLKSKLVPVSFSGRTDLAKYLSGASRRKPEI